MPVDSLRCKKQKIEPKASSITMIKYDDLRFSLRSATRLVRISVIVDEVADDLEKRYLPHSFDWPDRQA
jgi:hypothetical protein